MVDELEIRIIYAEIPLSPLLTWIIKYCKSTEGNQDHVVSGGQKIEISQHWVFYCHTTFSDRFWWDWSYSSLTLSIRYSLWHSLVGQIWHHWKKDSLAKKWTNNGWTECTYQSGYRCSEMDYLSILSVSVCCSVLFPLPSADYSLAVYVLRQKESRILVQLRKL